MTRNANRRQKIQIILYFYKLVINSGKVVIESGINNYVDQKMEIQDVALNELVSNIQNKIERLENLHSQINRENGFKRSDQILEREKALSSEILELKKQLSIIESIHETTKMLHTRNRKNIDFNNEVKVENKSV